jgi:SAM-dependent methyltransferase
LAVACEKRSRLPPSLTRRLGYFHGAVEDSPDEPYDLAAAMFNVVTYVPDVAALERFFGAVSRRLKPGASFVFDAWNGVAALRDPPRDRTTVVETETHRIKADLHCRVDPMRFGPSSPTRSRRPARMAALPTARRTAWCICSGRRK